MCGHKTVPPAPKMWHFTPSMTDEIGLRIPATYASSLVRAFREELAASGVEVDLAELGASPAGGQTQVDIALTLIAALTDTVGADWPARASFAWRNQMHGTIDVAARSADTFGDAVSVIARFGRARASFVATDEARRSGMLSLEFRPSIALDEDVWQPVGEFLMLGVMAILNQVTDAPLVGAKVSLPDRPYAHRALLEQAMQVPVEFGGEKFRISFSDALCAVELPFRDPALFKTAVDQLQSELNNLARHDWIVEDVRRLLEATKTGRPGAEQIARELGLSHRSLVRKLAAHGTSFRELLDDHLKARATALMEQGTLSSEQIAEELGYRDRTSFSRAKRRWFPSS